MRAHNSLKCAPALGCQGSLKSWIQRLDSTSAWCMCCAPAGRQLAEEKAAGCRQLIEDLQQVVLLFCISTDLVKSAVRSSG